MTGRPGGVVLVWANGLAGLSIVLSVAACRQPAVEQVEMSAAVPVVVESARTGLLQGLIAVTGVVTPAPGAEMLIVAPAAGRIAELPHSEGDRVTRGDLLVRFDVPMLTADLATARARVTQAEARLAAAGTTVTRLASLLDQGVAAPREVEDARRQQAEAAADLPQAQSAVAAAVALSERAVVRASFTGVVARRYHNPGDLVEAAAGDPVLRVINPSQLQVVAAVPESELGRVVVGHPAQVRRAGLPDVERATVLAKAPQIDPASATADVRLAFATPTSLTAGMTVQVEIAGEQRPNVLIIPVAALVDDDGDLFVMVAGADGKAHRYPVAVGLATRTLVEVTSGISAGDLVIVRGQDGLPEGANVMVEAK